MLMVRLLAISSPLPSCYAKLPMMSSERQSSIVSAENTRVGPALCYRWEVPSAGVTDRRREQLRFRD